MRRRTLFGVPAVGISLGLTGCADDSPLLPDVLESDTLYGHANFKLTPRGSGPDYQGPDSSMVDGDEVGLHIRRKNGYHLSALKFRNIAGTAVKVEQSGLGYAHVGYLSRIAAAHSYCGFKFADHAEYESVSDCNATSCVVGFMVSSGNNTFSNCKATNCTTGVKILGGLNSAHGVWNALLANHCTYNLVCEGVGNGEHFSGSCFIGGQNSRAGSIHIVKSQGISIVGGQVSELDVFVDAQSQVLFSAVTFGGKVNFRVEPGGILIARNNMLMPEASLTLNGSAWSGSDEKLAGMARPQVRPQRK